MSSEVRKAGRPTDTAKREAIVAAARDSFFERGFAASSIEQIAAAAGVSKVTVYNQFGDKRALFAAAVEEQCGIMRQHFTILPMMRGTLRERLTTIGEAMVAFLSREEMIQFDRRVAAETESDPEIGLAFLAAGPHRMKRAFTEFITAMQQAGELEVDDPAIAAEQFASMCKGMGDLDRRYGQPTDPEADRARIVAAVDVFCRAYATKGRS